MDPDYKDLPPKLMDKMWAAIPEGTRELLSIQIMTKLFEGLASSPKMIDFADDKVREVLRTVIVPQEVIDTIHREALASLRGRLNSVVASVVDQVTTEATQHLMSRFKGLTRY